MRIKKGLVALSASTVGLGLLVSRRFSRSDALVSVTGEAGQLDDHDAQSGFPDYLHAAAEGTAAAKLSLENCLRSLRVALEQRQQAVAAEGNGAAKPSSAVLLADFLTALHEGPSRPQLATFDHLSDWLLDRATAPLADPSVRRAACRYLSAVLRRQESAEALLQRPGAAPKLLQLAEGTFPLQQLLRAAVERAAPPHGVPYADVADTVRVLGGAASALRLARRSGGAGGQQEQRQAALTLALLLAWARASPANATRIGEAGAGPLLADLAASCATGTGVDGLQSLIAQVMDVLAHSSAKPQQLRMQGWLYHLLCFAADAAANEQWELAGAALSSFAACLLRGCELPEQLMQRSTLPLLRQLAAAPGSPVRPDIALVVRALAEGPRVQLPLDERDFWSDALLQWLVQLPGGGAAVGGAAAAPQQQQPKSEQRQQQRGGSGGEAQAAELMAPITAALRALAAPAGSDGLHVAHAWLAELIVHLSRQVKPYHAVDVPAEQSSASGADRGGGAAAAAAGGGGSWWWPFGGAGAAAAQADAAAAAAAAAAVGDGGAEVAAEEGAAEEVAVGPYLHMDAAAAAAAAAESAAGGAGGSWWRPSSWWPWGEAEDSREGVAAAKAAGAAKPSDSELALYINASEVGPLYARSVAAALLEASGRVGAYQEPPANAEELMGPEAVAVYPQVAAAVDMDLADSAVCQALKVLCALASGGAARRSWLREAGILLLLHRLTMERARDVAELPSGDYVEPSIPLCIQRQGVRLLAMLSSDVAGAGQVQAAGWIPWLQDLALSQDLKLSSCASRALLHIESTAAMQRPGLAGLALSHLPLHAVPAPLLPSEQASAAAAAAAAAEAALAAEPALPGSPPVSPPRGPGGGSPGVAAEAAELLGEVRYAVSQARRRLDRKLDAVRPPLPPEQRLVMQDGVHLFDPLAPHHEVLAREGIGATAADAPLLDIVFVHGIRGGAFATWRQEGVLEHGQARESLDRSVCWPASWLAKELPDARLISVEYAAPASGWEGEALPFQGTVAVMMEKLAAAGVGQRPIIFVSHSMGGLVVKDMLVTAKQQKDERLRKLASSAAGAVFYSVPHAGSRLADWGWYLRYIGGSPAKHVRHLKTGPHLDELNAAVRAMCKSGRLPVLSFSEGQPTKLGYIPTHVVPHESAYPGYGEFVVLAHHDHVSVCKPSDPGDPAYARLIAFLRTRVKELRRERADEAAASMDHMQAAAM